MVMRNYVAEKRVELDVGCVYYCNGRPYKHDGENIHWPLVTIWISQQIPQPWGYAPQLRPFYGRLMQILNYCLLVQLKRHLDTVRYSYTQTTYEIPKTFRSEWRSYQEPRIAFIIKRTFYCWLFLEIKSISSSIYEWLELLNGKKQ